MTKTLAYGFSSERTQRELFYENQHDRVSVIFKSLSFLGLRQNVASALEGLNPSNAEAIFFLRTSMQRFL